MNDDYIVECGSVLRSTGPVWLITTNFIANTRIMGIIVLSHETEFMHIVPLYQ